MNYPPHTTHPNALSPEQQAVKDKMLARRAEKARRAAEAFASAEEGRGPDEAPAVAGEPAGSDTQDAAQSDSQAPATFDLAANLPALIAALPDDETRATQAQFDLAAQRVFLDHLATVGSVRSAARKARVSHQTVYRTRRASPAFRLAWHGAQLVARARSEDALADRALDGVEEEVWYHGEVVAKRRRYDSRLLLAHLGRLDRLEERADVAGVAEDFEGALDRFMAGETELAPPMARAVRSCAKGAEKLSPGQCNTRSMSPPDDAGADVGEGAADAPRDAADWVGAGGTEPACSCAYADDASGAAGSGRAHYRRGAHGLEPAVNAGGGTGPCCDDPRWPDCRTCPHYPPVARVLMEMDDERPADAPDLPGGEVGWDAKDRQMDAFIAGDPAWWTVGLEERDPASGILEMKSAAPLAGGGYAPAMRDAARL